MTSNLSNNSNLNSNNTSNTYFMPNFHSINEINSSLSNKYNCFGVNSQIDFNGSGLYGPTVVQKSNKIANFYPLSPSLPHFLDNTRDECKTVSNNCLIECPINGKTLLLSTTRNTIIGQSIEVKSNRSHVFARDETVNDCPFRYITQSVDDLFVTEDRDLKPIFDLKVNSFDEKETQIQSTSRNKIRFFRPKEDSNDLDFSFDLFNEIDVKKVQTSDESMFECCHQNLVMDNWALMSHTSGNVVTLYDLETDTTVKSFDKNCFEQRSDQQIGLHWSEANPMMFFYGEHRRILYCDSRVHRPVLEVFNNQNNVNHFHWELFYQFLPTKLNDNQLFVSSDYHIFITDWRYPKMNLIQLNHMIPKTIIRNMKSLVVDNNGLKTEVLVSSNLKRNCLMSFTALPSLTALSSLHIPLHSSTPKDIDLKFEDSIYRGIQLIGCPNNSGFSLALLTQFGDIFMQDFYWCCDEDISGKDSIGQYRDRTFTSGFGSHGLELDSKTIQYMNVLNDYLYRLKCEKPVKTNDTDVCSECLSTRVCKKEWNECQCRDLNEFANTFDPSMAEVTTNREKVIEILYEKRLSKTLLKVKKKIENKQKLIERTDSHTKKCIQMFINLDEPGVEKPEPDVV